AYFQEAGRAGRDGKKAYAVLLYNREDKKRLEMSYETSFPPLKEVLRVYRALGSYFQLAIGGGLGRNFNFDLINFSKTYQFHPLRAFSCLKILEQSNLIVMTDAIYIPSQLKLLISKEQLYDYLLKNPQMELILKSILRNYQGAFRHFIKIKEGQLAAFLKMPKEKLIKTLKKLAHAKVLTYIPQKNEPQIIFTKARYDATELDMDYQLYNFRKEKYKERYQAAISYAETAICRSRLLLGYFSQTNAPKCGVCDVCTGRTKPQIDLQKFEQYKERLYDLLNEKELTLGELMSGFTPQKEGEILLAIEYLIDEGFITKIDRKYTITKH
ncbi:MAG TPA: RecQ family ATP-dependent DNA helicase, partial [Saprospiraceae bacterium]|nr:RecQ family ATP-dependent DNA helicase [Saprospiraceae bacterium]